MEQLETDLATTICRRMKQLRDVRRDYENGLWYDIARFVNPRRENIKADDYSLLKGQRRGKDAYDGTPLGALNTWADGMQGFLVSESEKWFRSEMTNDLLNDNDDVRYWLQEYDKAMYVEFGRSNFYAVLGEWFRDAGSIGTATLYTEEDIANKHSVHISVHPREIYISENRHGDVDTVFREFEMTARQLIDIFGEEKFEESFKDDAKVNPEKKHLIVHAVYPNEKPDGSSKNAKDKKFKSVYVRPAGNAAGTSEKNRVLREGGYDLNPYAVWRFRKNSDEVYGYSPAADALVEVFNLNQFSKTLIQAAQMSVEPSYNIPSEMRGNVRIMPKGYNYYDEPTRIIRPVTTGINYPVGIDQLERLQKSIEDKYRVEFFLTLARSTREMTAAEIWERKSEKATLMGPQVDRLTGEGLRKIFDITSDIADKAGRLPEPPDILKNSGAEIKINFVGPLAQAQKQMFVMQPIRAGIQELAPMAALKPELWDRIDMDELAETVLEAADFPQRLILNDDQVAQLRQQRAEQQQQQQQMIMAQGMAEAYPKVSKKAEQGSPADIAMAAMGNK